MIATAISDEDIEIPHHGIVERFLYVISPTRKQIMANSNEISILPAIQELLSSGIRAKDVKTMKEYI